MKRSLQLAGLAILISNTSAFGQATRGDSLYSAAATPDLLKDLQRQLAAAPSTRGLDRLRRVELAVRIIQVDLLLGERGSNKYAASVVRPARALEALDALQAFDPEVLNDLKNADARRVIWDAIAAAHPAYHLYVDAVRLAGHENDPEILERTLKPLLASWSKGSRTRPLSEIRQPLGEWGRSVLSDCLRVQAIHDAEGAMRLTAGIRFLPESLSRRPRKPGDPPAMSTRAFPILRGSGRLTDFDRALHQAAALQRAGYQVSFWSVAAEREIDADTKTIAQEPIVLFPEHPGKPALIALGARQILSQLKGEEVQPHIYRFPSSAALEDFLTRRVQYRVLMSDVLDAHSSPTAWAQAMQKFLATRTGAASPRELLLDLHYLAPWDGFTKAAADSLAVAAEPAFLKALDAHSIRLVVTRVKDGRARQPPVTVRDPNDRPSDLVLPRHEAVLGRAFQTLPPKFFASLQTINLRSEPMREDRPAGPAPGPEVVVKDVGMSPVAAGLPGRFMLASPDFPAAIHQLTNTWALARHEKFQVGDWQGTVVDAFNEISWQQADGKWAVRRARARTDDFIRPEGRTSEREDLAVESEHYVVHGKALRDFVRQQLRRGNLAPAAKYLYMKHVAFLNSDGKCIEYETDAYDPPFTRAEFDRAVRGLEARQPLAEEQRRLRDLVGRFVALAAEMIRSKRIV